MECPDQIKYFVSNASAGTPMEVLLRVAFSRWHVERCFQDEKEKLGLSHFEVRNYRSLRRHLILTAVSHLFLAKVHQKWRGEKSRVDGLPTSHGHLGAGAVFVADRAGATKAPEANSAHHHPDTRTTRAIPAQPRQEEAQTVA